MQRASELRAAGEHAKAVAILKSLPDIEHASIRTKLAEARKLALEIADELKTLVADANDAAQQAEKWIAERRYKEVIIRLQAIPQSLRTENIARLLETATADYREIKELRTRIAAAVEARHLTQLAPQIDRYLTLQPADEKVRTLAGRVRDHVNTKVREAVAAGDYAQASQLLECNPLTGLDDVTKQLQSEVREINRLHSDLKQSPHVDAGLLAVGKRLQQHVPQDAKIAKLVTELQKRLQQGPPNPRSSIIPWAAVPRNSQSSPPVEWISGFQRLRGANASIDEGVHKHSGEFFTAAGLALQGLNQAHIKINLLPAEKTTGLFGKLAQLRKAPVFKTAWGLDIGRSSLKAMKLIMNDTPSERPVIVVCDRIPHRLNLATPEAETQHVEIIRESLQVWRERHKPAEDEALCINGPSSRMLGRFFQIPSVKNAKTADIVACEIGHQIPYPIADLSWGFQVLDRNGPSANDGSEQLSSVVVLAMRSADARDQLQAFEQLGLAVHAMQAESIALHNYRVFDEPLSQEGEPVSKARCVAMLDVGADATNLVISSLDHVWFRTLRFGGNDINQALLRAFKLTFAQAEELKRQLAKAPNLHMLLETLDPVLGKLVSEIQRSMDAFSKEQPNRIIDSLRLCGGGVHQYGLLRQIISGPQR